ncbi:MAG TPA: CYTH and CHAD domain-containing protein [Microlunatus sp.]|nr:CYTH and CHAD domain-containing protein [Microlunatus sp.]
MQRVREREVTFDVPADWVMPDSMPPVRGGDRVVEQVRRLDSTYFDTASEGLRLFGITLRRRLGDEGTGWQLKVPNGTARIELQSGSTTRTVPRELADAVSALQGRDDLAPVATLSTIRTARRVLNSDGDLVLEIADDAVQSTQGDESTFREWREIEIELGSAGSEKALRKAGKWLRAAGATPSISRNKLDRALAHEAGAASGLDRSGTVGELVAAYVATQCDVIACNDVGLRTGQRLVHKTRVAVRRLRSTLRVFKDVVEAEPAKVLNDELVWYADLLGKVRDCDVLAELLALRISELPVEQVLGPVSADVQRSLTLERNQHWDRLGEEMAGERYQRLIGLIRVWRSCPPLTSAAEEKATDGGDYVGRAERKAYKRLGNAADDVEELHRARKALKRLRYAAELAEPADPGLASTAKKAKGLQTLLGDHQDAMVAARYLARLGAAAGVNPDQNGFTYGVLMANELHRAAAIRARLR